MPRKNTDRGLEADLDEDFAFDLLSDVNRRLKLVEHRDAADRIHREATDLMSGDDDADTDPVVAQGGQVLAKAQDVFHRIGTPEDVLQRAMKVMPDAVGVGIVQGFLAVGTQESFAKALSLVAEQEDRNESAHAETVVGGMLDDFDRAEDTQSLRDEVAELQQAVATLTGRLVQLESRPMSAPQEIVAKGYDRTSPPRVLQRTTRRRCCSADKALSTRSAPSVSSRALSTTASSTRRGRWSRLPSLTTKPKSKQPNASGCGKGGASMPVKKRGGTHVPRITGVTHEPSSSSRPGAANSDNATKHVTLASLAGDIAEIKLEIGVLVDCVRALENALADKD